MATIKDLRPSITELPFKEALALILNIRQNRRTPLKETKKEKQEKRDIEMAFAGLSPEQKALFQSMVQEKKEVN